MRGSAIPARQVVSPGSAGPLPVPKPRWRDGKQDFTGRPARGVTASFAAIAIGAYAFAGWRRRTTDVGGMVLTARRNPVRCYEDQ